MRPLEKFKLYMCFAIAALELRIPAVEYEIPEYHDDYRKQRQGIRK
jgi:hypothetical protein